MFSDLFTSFTNALFTTEVTPTAAILKLCISFLLGAVIGIERQTRRQNAGMRTITLICMASTAAMLLSIWVPQSYPHFLNGDPGRIAAQVITGIGFLGAGAIIHSSDSVRGLTTAACIWVVAIIGLCVGAGLYLPACVMTGLTLFVLIAFERVEKKKMMAGEIKLLSINYSTDTPDIEKALSILKTKSIFVFNVSIAKDFRNHSARVDLRIQANPRETFCELFETFRAISEVSSVSIRVI